MDGFGIAAVSGLRSRMEALELLANNLANAGAAGYKADRERYTLFVSPNSEAATPTRAPVIEGQWTDFSQAPLISTGNATDLAISGDGFFSVQGSSGPLYTRNGSFRFSAEGRLVTPENFPLLGDGGAPITIDPALPFEVARDGEVRQGGQPAGRIGIAQFADTSALVKQGASLFRAGGGEARPADGSVRIEQGKLEQSNVGASEGAVRLVGILRQFEMLQRAITIGGEMNRRSFEEVARVGT